MNQILILEELYPACVLELSCPVCLWSVFQHLQLFLYFFLH
jgi:hypothetical protein